MEVLVAGTVIGLGYLFTKEGLNRPKTHYAKNINKSNNPNGKTILESKRSYHIWQDEQKRANKLFEKTKDPTNSNVIIAGPTFTKTKVDYEDKKLPIEFNENTNFKTTYLNFNEEHKIGPHMTNNKTINNSDLPNSGGWNNVITKGPINPSQLYSTERNDEKFMHNNMVPFFGGHVKQNVDEFATRSIVENFTGVNDNYRKKKETGLFFKPVRNLTNVYGYQNFDSNLYDRYQTSRIRNNEAPIEQIRVGPGLNKGFTWKPSGGFQQSNTRDYVLPKTTDEIRVKNNPRVSYKGRIISGMHIAQPGKIGTMQKNLPDTFFVQQPDRYFTTTGQVIAHSEYPEFLVKHTNRKTTELKKRIGSAAPVHGTTENVRSKVKRSTKPTFDTSEPRNASIAGKWNIPGVNNKQHEPPHDYGKGTIKIKPNSRMVTGKRTVVINKKSPIEEGEYRNNQQPRRTRKTNVVGNARWASNVQAPHNRHTVYDPNDVPRTTIKETNIHNNYNGTMHPQAPSRGTVYDPNDVPRTTIKETNIHNNYNGTMHPQAPSRGTVYDPNDVPRTTIKETNIDSNRTGNVDSSHYKKPLSYDPNEGNTTE